MPGVRSGLESLTWTGIVGERRVETAAFIIMYKPGHNLLLLCGALVLACTGCVLAGDGRTEIDPGMVPLVINASGSYVVTGELVVNQSSNGIRIRSDDVSLDLNGYVLRGQGSSRHGITVDNGKRNVMIRNGAVRGWGRAGINAGGVTNLLLRSLQVTGCSQDGIRAGSAAVLQSCMVFNNDNGVLTGSASVIGNTIIRSNRLDGLVVSDNSVVFSTVTRDNGDEGLVAGSAVTVSEVTSRQNGGDGLRVHAGSLVHACTVTANAGHGIVTTGIGSKVQDCSSFGNGLFGVDLAAFGMAENTTVRGCTNGGFRAAGEGFVLRCSAEGCAGPGFTATAARVRFEKCHAAVNTYGFQLTGSQHLLIGNTAYANTLTNYSLGSGNWADIVINPGTSPPAFDNAWSSFDLFE